MPRDFPTDANPGIMHDPALALPPDPNHRKGSVSHEIELPPVIDGKPTLQTTMIGDDFPTEDELKTLRRVGDGIPWAAYTVAFVELCERLSYYGTAQVYTNFIMRPVPAGSTTGAVPDPNGAGINTSPGVLDMGQRAAAGITTMNTFWAYCTPLLGAYVADKYLGRYNTICIGIAIALVGHVILTGSAAPGLVQAGTSLAPFLIGLLIMGAGTGCFKPNISPLVAEQLPNHTIHVKEVKGGERVIVDPGVTYSRLYLYFYLFINVGALIGQISMSYVARFVGFYIAFLIPTLVFLLCPAVMLYCRNKYTRSAPEGSVLGPAFRLFFFAQKGCWTLNPMTTHKRLHASNFWEKVKPSNIPAERRPKWMTFDDAWVDEVGRGFAACSVFLWLPLYWLTYNQLNNNLTTQAGSMTLNGLPNDVLANLDPLALIIFIPIMDLVIYPGLRRVGIHLTPIKRIALGFLFGTLAMIWAAVLQQYIYWDSPCGSYATECVDADGNTIVVSINVWAQTGSYVLVAISEIFASITSLEYAFSKAPRNMRSLVMAFSLFMSAISAALGEAFVYLANDPLNVWNYGVAGVLSFLGAVGFWFTYRDLDRDEDRLNMLPTGHIGTKAEAGHIEEGRRASVAAAEAANDRKDMEKI